MSHALSASSVVWVVYCLWFVYNDMAHPNESESTWKETAVAWFKAVLRRLHRRADINHENSVSSRSPDRDLNTGPTEYDGSPPCSISAVYWRINTFTSLWRWRTSYPLDNCNLASYSYDRLTFMSVSSAISTFSVGAIRLFQSCRRGTSAFWNAAVVQYSHGMLLFCISLVLQHSGIINVGQGDNEWLPRAL